jgi:hypothetical protein
MRAESSVNHNDLFETDMLALDNAPHRSAFVF